MTERSSLNNEREALMQIVKSLPLETCEYKTDPVTNIRGRFAPVGQIFRVTGRFITDYLALPEDDTPYIPVSSTEEYIAENQEEFNNYVRKTSGDEQKALELLIEDNDLSPPFGDMPPVSFEGKWMHFEVGKSVSLTIRKVLEVWQEDQWLCIIENLTPDSDKKNPLRFHVAGMPEYAQLMWRQQYAEAVLGFCKVELVEYEEPQLRVIVPKRKPNEKKIYLPEPDLDTTDVFALTEQRTGKKLTDEERLEYMQYRRKIGKPLKDDPMLTIEFLKKPELLRLPQKKNRHNH